MHPQALLGVPLGSVWKPETRDTELEKKEQKRKQGNKSEQRKRKENKKGSKEERKEKERSGSRVGKGAWTSLSAQTSGKRMPTSNALDASHSLHLALHFHGWPQSLGPR